MTTDDDDDDDDDDEMIENDFAVDKDIKDFVDEVEG